MRESQLWFSMTYFAMFDVSRDDQVILEIIIYDQINISWRKLLVKLHELS